MIAAPVLREASSKAWWALKRDYKFYKAEVKDGVTTLKLFGDSYKFFFDDNRKMAWVESKHHFVNSRNFRLCTAHRNWEGIFSLPRKVAVEAMHDHFKAVEYNGKKVDVRGAEDAKKAGIEAKKVCRSIYRGDKQQLTRRFGAVLWDNIDREVGKLCMKMVGLSAGSLDYTLVANNKEEVIDTLEKAPGILPVWRELAILDLWHKSKQGQTHFASWNDSSVSLCQLADGDGPEPPISAFHAAEIFRYNEEVTDFRTPNILKSVKEHLTRKGLTNAGWRYLIKLKPSYTYRLMFGNELDKEVIPTLNWLAAIGVVPRFSIIKPLMRNLRLAAKTPSLTAMMRVGLREAEKVKGVKNFYDHQFMHVLDWMTRGGAGGELEEECFRRVRGGVNQTNVVLDANQKKASWAWFMRQQQAWHNITAERQKAKVAQQTWESALPTLELRGYEVVPLNSSHDLLDEGREMHHCVGSYANNCLTGRSRIFSIRKEGVKIATLEIVLTKRFDQENVGFVPGDYEEKLLATAMMVPSSVKWEVNQVRGHCNAEVAEPVKNLAKEIAKRYTKATKGEDASMKLSLSDAG